MRIVERRIVTVLFADVAGSTSLGELLDPEALRSVMSRYFEEMREVLEGHGGTVAVRSSVGEGTTFTVTLPRG